MRWKVGLMIAASLLLAGCIEDPLESGPSRSAAPEALGVMTDTVESAGRPVASSSEAAEKTAAAPEPRPKPERRREKAQAGASGRGNYGEGIITTPLSTYFRAQERVIFDQVKHALNIYKGLNGSAPKSHEEFMSGVIKANNINLPKLPEGDEYLYDPEKEELFVLKRQ